MSTKRTLSAFASLLLGSFCLMTGLAARTSIPDDTDYATSAYGRLPMSFVANQGQIDSEVKFISRGSGYHLYLTSTEAVLTLRKPASQNEGSESAAVLRMRLAGANQAAQVAGRAELPGKVNYFTGNDPAKWRTSVPTYARVQYTEVYPGVDLVYYGNPQQLEYDFVVAPGADPNVIKLDLEGVRSMRVDARGELVLRVEDADVRWQKPVIYQERDGVRREVAGNYVINAPRQVGFEVGAYDPSLPLVIDPVLVYSTYLGGSGTDNGSGIAVDASGHAYVTGFTASLNFPAGAFDPSFNAGSDAFVTKLNPAGTALVYSTFLGGSSGDRGGGIALDAFGNAFVTGTTSSADFPTTAGAFDVTFNGGVSDVFVTKLDATGAALVYSTFLGGTYGGIENLFGDVGRGIALDALGNVYVTGSTSSHDFPTTVGAYDTTHSPSAFPDVFVTKLSPAGLGTSDLLYSTYLGDGDDYGYAIAVDAFGSAYVTGIVTELCCGGGLSNFPTTSGAYDTSYNGGPSDAFVIKLNTMATGPASLVYSTFLGGSGSGAGLSDRGFGIAVDATGNAYVTGDTLSSNFPTTPGVFDTARTNVHLDAFVTKLNPAGTALVYSTYLGGDGPESAGGITVDVAGNASVTGSTGSPNFPTPAGPIFCGAEAFVTQITATGSALVSSTCLGGSGNDSGAGIAVDASGSIYVTGSTTSANFPTTPGALANVSNGGTDAFVAKIAGVDSDEDGVPDAMDAFPFDPAEWVDTDGDGIGNNDDVDDDGDGTPDATDAFPLDATTTVHNLTNGSTASPTYVGTTGTRDIFIWDMDQGALNGRQDIIAIDNFDPLEDYLVFQARATPHAPEIFPGVWADNVDSLIDTFYGTAILHVDEYDFGDGEIYYDEYYTYSEGSYRLLENSLARHNNRFGPTVFGEFEVEYRDVPGANAPRDIFQINGTSYVGLSGVKELRVMGAGGSEPLAIGDPALTSHYLFYNAVEVTGLAPSFYGSTEADTDGDGIGDSTDIDDDGDGVTDITDAFPLDAAEWVDTDDDATGDNADTDDDNDGTPDTADAFPLDTAESVDTDSDGTGNHADPDDDGDGVADTTDAFPLNAAESIDTDGDGAGNNADADDDNDGVTDGADALPLDASESIDTDGDGTGNNADTDDDGDGAADAADAFPLDAAESVDTDGDGTGNNADADDDGDGTPDVTDAFPLNAAESVDTDGDGTGNNVDTDDDGDGTPDATDAFPLNAAESVDTDGDGTGNNADTDDDDDGLPDTIDPFPTNSDADGDGIPDGAQPGHMRGHGAVGGGANRDHFEFDVDEGDRRRGRRDGDTLRLRYEREGSGRNRGRANRFESTAVTSIVFLNDPGFNPGRRPRRSPLPTIDTVIFTGAGKFNGASGYTFEATAIDHGEPGVGRDTFSLVVKDASGGVVFSESGVLSRGNIQSLRLPGRGEHNR